MIFLIIPEIILWVWFCLISYVLIYEDKRGMAALLRSKDLISGNWWGVFWRIIIIFGINFFISSWSLILFLFLSLFSIWFHCFFYFYFGEFYRNVIFFPFNTIYFALIYENLSLIKRTELEITLKRKLKYLLPTILAIIIIWDNRRCNFWSFIFWL